MPAVRLTRALILALALTLVACGSSSSGPTRTTAGRRYAGEVNRVQRSFAAQVSAAGSIPPGSSPTRERATTRAVAAAVTRAVGLLRAIAAPANVSGLHQQLVRALASYAAMLDRALVALRSANPAQAARTRARLLAATRRVGRLVNATLGEIEAKLA